MIDFGAWLPDQPSLGNPGIATLVNGFPALRGVKSVPSAAVVTQPQQSTGSPVADSAMPTIVGMHSTAVVSSGALDVRMYVGTGTRLLKPRPQQQKVHAVYNQRPDVFRSAAVAVCRVRHDRRHSQRLRSRRQRRHAAELPL